MCGLSRLDRGDVRSNHGELALTAGDTHAKPFDVKTYSINELQQLTKLSARTVRQYSALNMIPTPKFAGSATRYPRETLGKLLAIRKWRIDDHVATSEIRRALREHDAESWEAWAEEVDPLPKPPAKVVAPAPVTPPAPGEALGEKWHHVALMPGLMLLMREGAGEMTASVAREIQKRYRAG
jgi:DNA-binding transcriptional MerR regulator